MSEREIIFIESNLVVMFSNNKRGIFSVQNECVAINAYRLVNNVGIGQYHENVTQVVMSGEAQQMCHDTCCFARTDGAITGEDFIRESARPACGIDFVDKVLAW